MAAFVEFTIVRQERLGDDAQKRAFVDDGGYVVEATHDAEGEADQQHRRPVFGRFNQSGDGGLSPVQHCVLQEEVVDGVAGEAEFGADQQCRAFCVGGFGHFQCRREVGVRVGDRDAGRGGGDAGHAVVVDVQKFV